LTVHQGRREFPIYPVPGVPWLSHARRRNKFAEVVSPAPACGFALSDFRPTATTGRFGRLSDSPPSCFGHLRFRTKLYIRALPGFGLPIRSTVNLRGRKPHKDKGFSERRKRRKEDCMVAH